MHGITLTEAPGDWEVLQQKEGKAKVTLKGTFQVHPSALDVGVERVTPIVRVMREDDNMTVVPWTAAKEYRCDRGVPDESVTGSFETTLEIPAGGPYRIDTSLETKSTTPDLVWLHRGDCVLHIGVGNLFIIAGQSNSAGYSRDFCMDPPSMDVHLFRNRGRWDIASHPMNESTEAGSLPNEEMGVSGVSPYLSFGKRYAQLTGMPVGLIQTALGGSSMSQWMPPNGDLYRNMLDRIHRTGGNYAGVLWYQGCADTLPGAAEHYLEHFREYTEAVRRELGYEIPFFTMQLNRQINGLYDEYWGMVREAQRRAAKEIPKVYLITTSNLALCDGIHNTAPANVALGEKLAMQCKEVLNGGDEYRPPEVCAVDLATPKMQKECQLEGTGIWLRLICGHVKNCFIVYSALGQDSGFTLTDEGGEVEILHIRGNRNNKNILYLELARKPEGKAELSFAWQANPVRYPPVDEATYMPLVSFYRRQLDL